MNITNFSKSVDKTTNHIYFNIDLVNNETIDDNNNSPELKYSDFRDVALINDCSEYYFSIVRFQLNGVGKSLPIFIPKIEENQSDVDKTIYKIGIMYNYHYKGVFYQKKKVLHITFKSQNKNESKPLSPNDYSNKYYFIYTYSHFVNLVNETFKKINDELYEELKAEHNINDSFKPEEPKLYYMNGSQLFKLYLDKSGYGRKNDNFIDTTVSPATECDIKCRLFFNTNMYNLFSNFHNHYLGGDVNNRIEYYENNNFNDLKTISVPSCSYEILPFDILGLDTYSYNSKNYYVMKQDFESTSNLWCPISSIVFTSNIIPILPEQSGTPIEFKDSGAKQNSISNYEKVITDLIIPLGNADGYNGCLSYFGGGGEYRLSEFTKSQFSLRNIGLRGFFKLRNSGKLIPLTMPNQSSVSLKLMFRHRNFSK